ncbi:hypothetical protein FQR65_LT15208 [Abscondita terminalis]|nr:hypothetical protein FQR65_LT15208 [Abscondita terminalis]
MCGVIASDEARHAKAYMSFISQALVVDASEVILAFEDMMRKKIVMPAQFLRESGEPQGEAFAHFSDAAQRLGVYTAIVTRYPSKIYIDWVIILIKLTGLTEQAEKARDYLLKLPDRLLRLARPMVGYWFLGVENPVLWGGMTAVSTIIPVLGTMTIYVPLSIFLFANGQIGNGVGLLLYGFLVIGGIDNVLRFTILKKLGDVPPLITVFGVLLGLKLFELGVISGSLILSSVVYLLRPTSKNWDVPRGIPDHQK